jgi:hypothetical protein
VRQRIQLKAVLATFVAGASLVTVLAATPHISAQEKQTRPQADDKADDKEVEVAIYELRDVGQLDDTNPLFHVKVLVVLKTSQVASPQGISLSVEMENKGEKDVNLILPLDFLSFTLRDEKGRRVMPNVPSRLQVNRPGGKNELSVPFNIRTLVMNKVALAKEATNATRFTLSAKGTFEVPISIDRIVSSRDEKGENFTVPSPGLYKLVVSSLLNVGETKQVTRWLQSPQIEVNLTE